MHSTSSCMAAPPAKTSVTRPAGASPLSNWIASSSNTSRLASSRIACSRASGSAVQAAGMGSLNEGQKIRYEVQQERGKTAACDLKSV